MRMTMMTLMDNLGGGYHNGEGAQAMTAMEAAEQLPLVKSQYRGRAMLAAIGTVLHGLGVATFSPRLMVNSSTACGAQKAMGTHSDTMLTLHGRLSTGDVQEWYVIWLNRHSW